MNQGDLVVFDFNGMKLPLEVIEIDKKTKKGKFGFYREELYNQGFDLKEISKMEKADVEIYKKSDNKTDGLVVNNRNILGNRPV